MTPPDDALRAFCAREGVATSYEDIWGHPHEAHEDGLRAILAELGVPATDAAALAEAQAADWRVVAPPVLCVTAGEPVIELALRIPADAARVRLEWRDEQGAGREDDIDATRCETVGSADVQGRAMRSVRARVEAPREPGYHELRVAAEGLPADASGTLVIVAPATCWRPPALHGTGRTWGPALQLYALRSERNWGMGDFTDLAQAAEFFAERGAGVVGVNPLHALFPNEPNQVSPYSPSSRAHLNVLYIDVEGVEDFRDCEEAQRAVRSAPFQQRLAALRAGEHVDAAGVAAAKFEILRVLWQHFRERHLRTSSARGRAFRSWAQERGAGLRLHATCEAIQEHLQAADPAVRGWPQWPEGLRDPASPKVRAFQARHAERIEYHEWLQWLADGQLQRVSQRLRRRGLAVGLYLDLAVSIDRAGSDAWAHAGLHARGASIGAPPDEVNRSGQDWGLPPPKPREMMRERLASFRESLVACMRHAGALRIDHAMGLMRLYWIPPQAGARAGAYVHYPLREQLAVIALESHRQHCLVVGEDLGTVPDALREALGRAEVLSYRLVMFEREPDGAFRPPATYPPEALVAFSTHDLATLRGWWEGHDLATRRALGLYPDEATYEEQLAARVHERVRLLIALRHAELLPEGTSLDPAAVPEMTPALAEAVHAYAAATPSRLMLMQLEDALGILDAPNLPGTVDEVPNWRRRIPLPIEQWPAHAALASTCARLARERPQAGMLSATAPPLEARVPRATYRLQFHKDFTFEHARAVLPYLARLGVSHVYCSPLTRARPGSLHGYDVVAHDEINPEIGGREGFDRFAAAARAAGLGLLLDLVPNHMGIGPDNAWWMDVLENGPASMWARYFDIDWHPADASLDGKVLLPVLGQPFGRALEAGELRVCVDAALGRFSLHYFDHRFPLDPRTAAPLLKRAAARCAGAAAQALDSLASAHAHLPPRDADGSDDVQERARDKALLRTRLAALLAQAPEARAALEAAVEAANAPDELDALHADQAYRLAYWRVASDEINYRRFFDINDLAALRMEEPAVFEATHGYALELAASGLVDGLRIDHPDGLADPADYFERLQRGYAQRTGLVLPAVPEGGRLARPLYVVAEKIAASHEDVPDTWALHGTTGYRFANLVNGVLVDTTARERFDRLWRLASRSEDDFEQLAYEGRWLVMRTTLAAGLGGLATELLRIARSHRLTRDFTWNVLREALAEVTACMPVYRTYVVRQPSAQDVRYVEWAVAAARRRARLADASVFEFVRDVLLGRAQDGADAALAGRVLGFAMRYQQFSAPVMAKGVEDTAFYRYHRLVALNEVGGDPGTFGLTLRGFHGANADRAARWPGSLIATSTHDNKRSEDVRCRLDVLSEIPGPWRLVLRRLHAAPQLQRARASRPGGGGEGAAPAIPSGGDEMLLMQTLLGTLPAGGLDEDTLPPYRERIEAYMVKAVREAKLHTSWLQPDAEYEDGLAAFVRSVLARVRPNPALTELQALADRLAWFGAFNSVAMAALKLTAPGVPDLYQGNEMLDLSLVDPDNRRPVDYASRERMLDELESRAVGKGIAAAAEKGTAAEAGNFPNAAAGNAFALDPGTATALAAELAATPTDGRLKLWVTWRLLQLRARLPELFRDGAYAPLAVRGSREEHVIAFARQKADDQVVVAAGRFLARLSGLQPVVPAGTPWQGTTLALPGLPAGAGWRDVLTGRVFRPTEPDLPLDELFRILPLAVLVPA